MNWFRIAGFLGLVGVRLFAAECQQGKTAFETTVYPKIMRDCAMCHDGSSKAPAYAIADVSKSYYRVLNYSNFSNMEKMTLVDRAGNGHCAQMNCDESSGKEMLEMVHQWWESGQKECPADSTMYTAEEALPNPLPFGAELFAVMKWDLGVLSQKFAGFSLSIEVKRFAKPTKETPGAYLFRKPRIWGNGKGIAVKGLRLYVNRSFDGVSTNFTTINTKIISTAKSVPAPYPLLSPDSQIVVQLTETDLLSVGFESLELADPMTCKSPKLFEEQVLSRFADETCFRCHGGKGAQGTPEVATVFSMDGSVEEVCRRSLERLHPQPDSILLSSLVSIPLHGKLDHPKAVKDATSYIAGIRQWAAAERVATNNQNRRRSH